MTYSLPIEKIFTIDMHIFFRNFPEQHRRHIRQVLRRGYPYWVGFWRDLGNDLHMEQHRSRLLLDDAVQTRQQVCLPVHLPQPHAAFHVHRPYAEPNL